MKKLFLWLIVIILIGGFYYFSNRTESPNPQPTEEDSTAPSAFQIDPSNGTFTFDGERVTLSQGRKEGEGENGFYSETRILESQARGDVNADGKEDVILFIARSGGGSGVFVYVAGFISSPTGHRGTEGIFIGDRISPQSLSIEQGVITARFLDRSSDEPYSTEPTIPTTRQFVVTGGELKAR